MSPHCRISPLITYKHVHAHAQTHTQIDVRDRARKKSRPGNREKNIGTIFPLPIFLEDLNSFKIRRIFV